MQIGSHQDIIYIHMYEKAKKGFKLPTKRVVVFISDVVHDEFTTYCEEHDYIRPRLIELILEEFLERHGMKPVDKNVKKESD